MSIPKIKSSNRVHFAQTDSSGSPINDTKKHSPLNKRLSQRKRTNNPPKTEILTNFFPINDPTFFRKAIQPTHPAKMPPQEELKRYFHSINPPSQEQTPTPPKKHIDEVKPYFRSINASLQEPTPTPPKTPKEELKLYFRSINAPLQEPTPTPPKTPKEELKQYFLHIQRSFAKPNTHTS